MTALPADADTDADADADACSFPRNFVQERYFHRWREHCDKQRIIRVRKYLCDGGYRGLRQAGAGYFAVVFEAEQPAGGGVGGSGGGGGSGFGGNLAAADSEWPTLAEPRRVAIKVPRQYNLHSAYQDVAILRHVQHPHIVRYYRWLPHCRALLMEWCPLGSVQSLLTQRPWLCSLDFILTFAVQVSDALCYLHRRERRILHLDLRPCNVLCSEEDGRIVFKLADFGIARVREEGDADNDERDIDAAHGMKQYDDQIIYQQDGDPTSSWSPPPVPDAASPYGLTVQPAPRWFPPEVQFGYFGEPTDVWSFGAVLCYLLERCVDPDTPGSKWPAAAAAATTPAAAAAMATAADSQHAATPTSATASWLVPAAGSCAWTRQQVRHRLSTLVVQCCSPAVADRPSSDGLKRQCESICLLALFHRHAHEPPASHEPVPIQWLPWSLQTELDEKCAASRTEDAYEESGVISSSSADIALLLNRGTQLSLQFPWTRGEADDTLFFPASSPPVNVPSPDTSFLPLLLRCTRSLSECVRHAEALRLTARDVHDALEPAYTVPLACAQRRYRRPDDGADDGSRTADDEASSPGAATSSSKSLPHAELLVRDWRALYKFRSWAVHGVGSVSTTMMRTFEFHDEVRALVRHNPLFLALAGTTRIFLEMAFPTQDRAEADDTAAATPGAEVAAAAAAAGSGPMVPALVDEAAAGVPSSSSSSSAASSAAASFSKAELNICLHISGELPSDGLPAKHCSYRTLVWHLQHTLLSTEDGLWTRRTGAHSFVRCWSEVLVASGRVLPSTMLSLLFFLERHAGTLVSWESTETARVEELRRLQQEEDNFGRVREKIFSSDCLLDNELSSVDPFDLASSSRAAAAPLPPLSWQHPSADLSCPLLVSYMEIALQLLAPSGLLSSSSKAQLYRAAVCRFLVSDELIGRSSEPVDRACMLAADFVLAHAATDVERQQCRQLFYARVDQGTYASNAPCLPRRLAIGLAAEDGWLDLHERYKRKLKPSGVNSFGLPLPRRPGGRRQQRQQQEQQEQQPIHPSSDSRLLLELLPDALVYLVPWANSKKLHAPAWQTFLQSCFLFCRRALENSFAVLDSLSCVAAHVAGWERDVSARLLSVLLHHLSTCHYFQYLSHEKCEEWARGGLAGYAPFVRLLQIDPPRVLQQRANG